MLEKGKLVPNWTLVDETGKSHRLWDFRQKTNLILLVDPNASDKSRACWRAVISQEQKQWVWLQAEVLIITQAPPEMASGVYLIDRYGQFMTQFPIDQWTPEVVQREFVYHEARHC